jgi:hypothetical protein
LEATRAENGFLFLNVSEALVFNLNLVFSLSNLHVVGEEVARKAAGTELNLSNLV